MSRSQRKPPIRLLARKPYPEVPMQARRLSDVAFALVAAALGGRGFMASA